MGGFEFVETRIPGACSFSEFLLLGLELAVLLGDIRMVILNEGFFRLMLLEKGAGAQNILLVLVAESHHCYQCFVDCVIISSSVVVLSLALEFFAAVEELLVLDLEVTDGSLIGLSLQLEAI